MNQKSRGKPYSRQEAEALLGRKTNTLRAWASTKAVTVPFAKIGSRCVYFENDINEFINSHMVGLNHKADATINRS